MKNRASKIYVAGHTGLVGSAIVRELQMQGYTHIIVRTQAELDLRRQAAVEDFFASEAPEYVFLAAARVGGIHANKTMPADFLYDNLMIAAHALKAAHEVGTKKVLFLGSSCIYPRDCPQPIAEEQLLTGLLEQTNEAYAIAKIAGLKLCQAFCEQYGNDVTQYISVMPTNVYGIGDTFHRLQSHVIPALIMKAVAAVDEQRDAFVVWGTGKPRREFLYVDDLARGLVLLMQERTDPLWINIGTGYDYSIAEIASMIAEEAGFTGTIVFDHQYPDGTLQKLLNVSRMMEYNWQPQISLREGLQKTIAWYRDVQRRGI